MPTDPIRGSAPHPPSQNSNNRIIRPKNCLLLCTFVHFVYSDFPASCPLPLPTSSESVSLRLIFIISARAAAIPPCPSALELLCNSSFVLYITRHEDSVPMSLMTMGMLAQATENQDSWAPVVLLLVIAIGFAVVNVGASLIIGPSRTGPGKEETYESGMVPIGDTHKR